MSNIENKEFFYSNIDENKNNIEILNELMNLSEELSNQIYVIDKALGEKDYTYKYKDVLVVLIPKHKILFIDIGDNKKEFEYFVDDFIHDLGYISKKYEYLKLLGRPREWDELYTTINFDGNTKNLKNEIINNKVGSKEKERLIDFMISLLTGSINDVNRLGEGVPNNILDEIKRKIILFDSDQTTFIYKNLNKKRIVIQGLSGTGKTELLLHKLKEIYTGEKNSKIVLTCHNKILAENLNKRIPEFFNFMKVEEQIEWKKRLWAINGWGSSNDENSGVYSYICNFYQIPFQRYSYFNTFDRVCKNAIRELKLRGVVEPCFDYMLIDESQDFPESFFELCEMVTRKSIYVAGDIFQDVFEKRIKNETSPDFLLNKCYRTDPRTLMFAHAVGMGLLEKDYLRWLSDDQWKSCGYIINSENGYYNISRKKLRRFEDLYSQSIKSIELIKEKNRNYTSKIIETIIKIRREHPTVQADDIGIIFLENIDENYALVDSLEIAIRTEFEWKVNIGYKSKMKVPGTLFISNRNNVKGLEFPFIICITQGKITREKQKRNSVYMMLTRSFITTYFLISSENNNSELIKSFENGIKEIEETVALRLKEPPESKKIELENAIINNESVNKSPKQLAEEIMEELNIPENMRDKIHTVINTIEPNCLERTRVYELIESVRNIM